MSRLLVHWTKIWDLCIRVLVILYVPLSYGPQCPACNVVVKSTLSSKNFFWFIVQMCFIWFDIELLEILQVMAVTAPPQVIVQPPAPKELRNKALLCKPFMQTKATSCRPHSIAKSTQTGKPKWKSSAWHLKNSESIKILNVKAHYFVLKHKQPVRFNLS